MSNVARRYCVVLIIVPLSLALVAFLVGEFPYSKYTRGIYELLVFLLIVDLAIAIPGKWRDGLVSVASLIFGVAVIELICAFLSHNISTDARGFSVVRPELGWGPSAPGVYRGLRKSDEGRTVYDVDYTIDDNLLRHTVSAKSGPTVAFFGDSMMFGQGLPDDDTLPQAFAVLAGRKLRVLNFGFPGYGPQQLLRIMETGIFDPLLKDTKIFVFQASGWQIERASCRASYVARAPRYDLDEGRLIYKGACAEGLMRPFYDVVLGSALYQKLVAPVYGGLRASDVEIYLAELDRCGELAKQKYGARFVVLYLSEADTILTKTGFTDAKIEERLRQGGVDVLDATLSPNDFPPGTLLRISGDGHPTAIANHARAEMLQKFLGDSTLTAPPN